MHITHWPHERLKYDIVKLCTNTKALAEAGRQLEQFSGLLRRFFFIVVSVKPPKVDVLAVGHKNAVLCARLSGQKGVLKDARRQEEILQ